MKFSLPVFLAFIFLAISCQAPQTESKTKLKEVKEKVYNLKEVAGEFVKDQVKFLETYTYDVNGIENGHFYFNLDGSLKAKEEYLFEKDKLNPIGSKYYDSRDSLLSYYSVKFDKKGQMISKWGFDAKNNEPLRIENYTYNDKGHQTKKEIVTTTGVLEKTHNFDYDNFGNIVKVSITDQAGNRIFEERYDVTRKDKDGRFIEKWGFINDKPSSFRERTYRYR